MSRRIAQSSFTIVANGFADGPDSALLEFLLARGSPRIQMIAHPLVEGDTHHLVRTYEDGCLRASKYLRLPVRLPYTYPLDFLIPLRPAKSHAWFGFNCLACARGLVARGLGHTDNVVYWCVDFVPERFGRGVITKVYDRLDRYCCGRADVRFELSDAAREGREQRHRLSQRDTPPAHIVPMGAWLDRVPTTDPNAHERRTLVFLGHLRPGQGVGLIISALVELRRRGLDIRAELVGSGPLQQELRRTATLERVDDSVIFHGFVPDHRDVETILASGSIALAPYEPDPASFTRYADPGKLKAYLAAGLPTLLTDVPPNAHALAEAGGAELLSFEPAAFADAVERLISDRDEWRRRRTLALRLARRFDWNVVLEPALAKVGFVE